ncbi:murein L,D-transpeptidase catalytic domain family protein [Parabacteroides sp.]
MHRIFLYLLLLLLPANYSTMRSSEPRTREVSGCQQLYQEMKLEGVVNYTAFEQAITGYNRIDEKSKEILTLIDFSKPSTEERFYVFDMRHKKLLFTSLVSHGKNSGGKYATSFSNENGSLKSSLGFFLTENTYQGKNGYSLVLNGLEKGINDRAKERAIVIHGAAYSNPSVIASSGRLGRSFGCPALPQAVSKPIINTIKNGSLLYIYANNQNYLSYSPILSEKIASM